jgi:neutral ceramidase
MARRLLPLVLLTALLAAAPAQASGLRAGAGRADITPRTGYYMFGWVRSDARAQGQLTRLFARTIVLQRRERKVALVSADMGAIPNGLVVDAAKRVRSLGYSDRNVIVSASHTHSAATGYFNYPAFNTVAPTDTTPGQFQVGKPADEELYSFLSRQLAASIRRADRDLAPARAGWGSARLAGLTENRSLEAHLADHGIIVPFGAGQVSMDPKGYIHTVDPKVSVLRVDKIEGGRGVPIGMWSTFADHGTVVKPTFTYYNADHHAAAARVAEDRIRRIADVPRSQEIVNSYGNSDEGDITAGIEHSGPAGAYEVGRREALAMVRAWRHAGHRLDATPKLSLRWTRACFCGRSTAAGPVDTRAVVGLPFLTGSEENRGPLYDETGIPFEGYRSPVATARQGNKIQTIRDPNGTFPDAVPLSAVRVGSEVIVTIPGEMSEGMGRRLRQAVLRAARGSGIRQVVVSGLANDFIQYLTTPEEYGRQHYEGGSTLFGPASGVFIQERLTELVRRMGAGRPAPSPDSFDPVNGVDDGAAPYGLGARRGVAISQPSNVHRLDRASFRWSGGQQGLDRPLDRAFVTVQRRARGHWRDVDDDLGLDILWKVDDEGHYTALWEAPRRAALGRYRFVITANRYRLRSEGFALRRSTALRARLVRSGGGGAVIELRYPAPVENRDLTWRPRRAPGKRAELRIGHRRVAVQARGDGRFRIEGEEGRKAVLEAGAARDRYGNRNRNRLSFKL